MKKSEQNRKPSKTGTTAKKGSYAGSRSVEKKGKEEKSFDKGKKYPRREKPVAPADQASSVTKKVERAPRREKPLAPADQVIPVTKKVEKAPRTAPKRASKASEIRLNKYIAHAGICSRREADKLIEAGLVSVNGKIVAEVGTKVSPDDDVRYNGERLGNEKKVYLVLNKPKDFVTSVDDPHAKKTVMDLISNACKERIYPVGRLDKSTTGVLLFTNDGELTRKLTHPSFNKKKIYHVYLDKNLTHNDMQKIAEGLELEDGPVKVDAIAYASQENKREVGLEIHSGKNRIVRRIFESLDYKVTRLDRVYFAGLTKKNLPRGRWRFLTDKEIKSLKMNAFE